MFRWVRDLIPVGKMAASAGTSKRSVVAAPRPLRDRILSGLETFLVLDHVELGQYFQYKSVFVELCFKGGYRTSLSLDQRENR
jgi:hypothetical protein